MPEGESVEAATPASLTPFEPAVDAPLTDVSPPERLHATLDALNWLRRNPRHDGRTGGGDGGGEGAAAAALPPVEAMESLVGRAVEVLWPSESAWYPALVRAYNAVDGKHFLAYADGDVEWLALSSGCAHGRPAAAQTLGVRASSPTPAHPTRPFLSRRYYGWQLLQGPKAATLLEQLRLAAREQNRHAPAGLPLGFTTGGDRLFAPAPTCAGCQVAGTAPGRLLQCARCARGWHAKCVGMPTVDVAAAQGGEWVCGHCATCDGCGALAVSEIEGHWAPDAAHDLQNGWYVADGHKLLCVACHGGVRSGGCDAKTLERWGAGAHGAQCGACSLWCATPADAGAAAGKPMPPPPPASVGGGSFKPKKVDRCGRCDGELLYLELRDALDELQALDPLRYFWEPVDEEAEPLLLQYNDPFTAPWARRNEVAIPVKRA